MNKAKLIVVGIVVIVAGIVLYSSMFTVHETEQVLVLQLGKFQRVIKQPGLHFKMPFVQNIVSYERRVLEADPPKEQVILSDQKRLDVDAYVRYRIADPLKFFQSVTDERLAASRLGNVVNSTLRRVLGNVTLLTVLSGERAKVMSDIRIAVNEVAHPLGIEIIDVRLRRADLPEQAAQAVFARMRSEREQEAREARAQGFEKAQRIRAGADREKTVLLAEAEKESEITRGAGDKLSYRISAQAYSQDPEFYGFYRSMQAYRNALRGEDTTMVLSPDSEFFRYFGTFGKRTMRTLGVK
jgi:membrane protease subunit HflC